MSNAFWRSKLTIETAATDDLSRMIEVVFWRCKRQAVVEDFGINPNWSVFI